MLSTDLRWLDSGSYCIDSSVSSTDWEVVREVSSLNYRAGSYIERRAIRAEVSSEKLSIKLIESQPF